MKIENEEIAEMREKISELRTTLVKLGRENKELLDFVKDAHGILGNIEELKERIIGLEDAVKSDERPETTVSLCDKLNGVL